VSDEQPTIREATAADLDAVELLLRAQPSGFARRREQINAPRVAGRRHLLVLDAPDGEGLAAAALVDIDDHRGHLVLLAVARRFEGAKVEDRMIGVAEALCKAFGADTLDVPTRDAA
jgi:N-acetylglutamate synthase-like GNAT family acetyltransferase